MNYTEARTKVADAIAADTSLILDDNEPGLDAGEVFVVPYGPRDWIEAGYPIEQTPLDLPAATVDKRTGQVSFIPVTGLLAIVNDANTSEVTP